MEVYMVFRVFFCNRKLWDVKSYYVLYLRNIRIALSKRAINFDLLYSFYLTNKKCTFFVLLCYHEFYVN